MHWHSFKLLEHPESKHCLRTALLLAGAFCMLRVGTIRADERMFTYSYEASSVLPKGGVEFEQWITYRGGKQDGVFAAWDLREEIEYGVTDRYTTALYLNFRNTHSDGVAGMLDTDEFEFKGISSEHKYQLLNPHTKPIGVLLYGEVTTDGKELELEQKLVLQKFLGKDERWNLAFNATVEEEWEFEAHDTERELALDLTAGISYKLTPNWAVGLEGRNHRVFPDFSDEETSAYFVGPNIHYGRGKWWTTLTVLPQVSGHPDTRDGLQLEEHERVEVRLIAGFNF